MNSKRNRDGELLIDHRNSPGISAEWAREHNIGGPVVGAGQIYERAIKTCTHCGSDVVMNPGRVRDREWCWACDAYICDGCGLIRKLSGYQHRTTQQIMSELYEALQRRF